MAQELDPAVDPSAAPVPLSSPSAPSATPAGTPAGMPAPPAELNVTPPSEPAAAGTPASEPLSPQLKKLAELGFQGVTEQDAFDRLAAAYELQQKTFQRTIAEFRQQPAAAPAPVITTANDGRAPWWNPPNVDANLIAQFRQGDGWKPGTPQAVIEQSAALSAYQDAWARKLISDPKAALAGLREELLAEAVERVQQHYGQTTAEQQQAQVQQKVATENPWLFATDPVTGKPNTAQLSPAGNFIHQHMQELQQGGANWEASWKYAHALYQAATAKQTQQTATTAQTAQQINDQKKRELLAKGNGNDRTGVLPKASDGRTTPNQSKVTFRDRFRQNIAREGTAPVA